MKTKMTTLAAIAAVFFLAGSSGLAFAQSDQAAKSLSLVQSGMRDIAKKVLPVVVEIDVTEVIKQQAPQLDSPFNWFFNQPPGNGQGGGERTFRQQGLGSGIIVRRSGDKVFVLTNNHVVKDATEVSVKLADQRVYKAKVVGADPRKDIALVSFDSRENLPVAELGDSNALEVGDLVVAVGNPFGFASTVTLGIVSALGRRGPGGGPSAYTDYIQTDAAINQGNSGGALVNIQGEVIGMNTWIAAPSGGSVGLGFAIPINNAKRAIDDFISKGKVEYGWLGVQIGDIQDPDVYPGFARDLKVEGVKGAAVLNVYKGSPADRAGLLPGDYVTAVDNAPVADSNQLTQAVGALLAGKAYTFELYRNGEKVSLSVRIGARDAKDEVAQYKNLWPGMTVVNLTDRIRQEANIQGNPQGVVIGYLPDQDTPASIAGFKPGDVITGINGKKVRSMMDYYRALNDKGSRTVTFQIVREGTEISVGLTR
jgi:Do/DeqQ family serine protease